MSWELPVMSSWDDAKIFFEEDGRSGA